MVIELCKQGVSPKEIAHQIHISLRDVYRIIKKEYGEKETEQTNELRAIKLFDSGKTPVEAVKELSLPSEEVTQYYLKFLDLTYLGKFGNDYEMVKENLKDVLVVCELMKEVGMKQNDLINAAYMVPEIAEMEIRHSSLIDLISKSHTEYTEIEAKKSLAEDSLREAEDNLAKIKFDIEMAMNTKKFVDTPSFKPEVFRRFANARFCR